MQGSASDKLPVVSKRTSIPLLLVGFLIVSCGQPTTSRPLRVAAASSLRTVLPEIVRLWDQGRGEIAIEARFDASGTLSRQVEAGAPTDLVVLAAARPVEDLIEAGVATPSSRTVVAYNQLCLVGVPESPPRRFANLHEVPPGVRIAVGDPSYVPVGAYARQAFRNLESWAALRPHLVYGTNVAAVLAWVARGEAAYGVVYRTDARARPELSVLDEPAGDWAPRPEVVAAVVSGAPPTGDRFLRFLLSPAAQSRFEAAGFGTIADDSG